MFMEIIFLYYVLWFLFSILISCLYFYVFFVNFCELIVSFKKEEVGLRVLFILIIFSLKGFALSFSDLTFYVNNYISVSFFISLYGWNHCVTGCLLRRSKAIEIVHSTAVHCPLFRSRQFFVKLSPLSLKPLVEKQLCRKLENVFPESALLIALL